MSVDTTVTVITSSQTGAPTLQATAGNLISVLDACLCDGFGLVTATSVVISSGVGTATFGSGHSATVEGVVVFAGATGTLAALNGRRKVTATGTSTVTFSASDLADGTVSGTITMKVAPLGWTKAFRGTNLAAYKSSNTQASGAHLYVDDTTTTYASVRGYLSMSAIDTGVEPFPTTSQSSVSCWWKSNTTGSNRTWWIVGNDRFFYFGVGYYSTYGAQPIVLGFGDAISRKSSDAYRAILMSLATTTQATSGAMTSYQPVASGASGALRYMPRPYSGVGTPVSLLPTWLDCSSGFSGYGARAFPNATDNSIVMSPIVLAEGSSYRAQLPGVYATPQLHNGLITDHFVISGMSGYSGRLLYKQAVQTMQSAPLMGGLMFDVVGPWAY